MGRLVPKGDKKKKDLQGLKFRIAGIGGMVLAKLGVVTQQIAAGDLYAALERGTIDAAEMVGPFDDEKLGLQRVAPDYYYPGWWEGQGMTHYFINLPKWNSLPQAYQSILRSAAARSDEWMLAKYDAVNSQALRRLVAGGTKLSAFSPPIMDACLKAALELYSEISANNPNFKRAWGVASAVQKRTIFVVAGRGIFIPLLPYSRPHTQLRGEAKQREPLQPPHDAHRSAMKTSAAFP